MNVVCCIPARGGSKGVSKKNIKDLGGIPLICHSINVAILRPTTPIRCARILMAGIELFEKNECSSMRSAHEAPESPYKWFEIDREGIYWKHNLLADMPRQSLPKVYIPNGYLDITKRETIERGSAYGDKILSFMTDFTTEIDTKESFDYLEYLISK